MTVLGWSGQRSAIFSNISLLPDQFIASISNHVAMTSLATPLVKDEPVTAITMAANSTAVMNTGAPIPPWTPPRIAEPCAYWCLLRHRRI